MGFVQDQISAPSGKQFSKFGKLEEKGFPGAFSVAVAAAVQVEPSRLTMPIQHPIASPGH